MDSRTCLRLLAQASDPEFLGHAESAVRQARARLELREIMAQIPVFEGEALAPRITMESHSETISGTGKRTEILFALETARVPAPAGVTQHFFKLIHVDNSEMVEEGETKLTLFLGRRTVRDPEFAEVPNQVIQSKQRRIYRRKKFVLSNSIERELEDEIIRAYMTEASVPLALFVRLSQAALIKRGLINVGTQLAKFLRLADEVLATDAAFVWVRLAGVGLDPRSAGLESYSAQLRALFASVGLDYNDHEERQQLLEADSSADEGRDGGDLFNTDGEESEDEPNSSDLDFVVPDDEENEVIGGSGSDNEGDEDDDTSDGDEADEGEEEDEESEAEASDAEEISLRIGHNGIESTSSESGSDSDTGDRAPARTTKAKAKKPKLKPSQQKLKPRRQRLLMQTQLARRSDDEVENEEDSSGDDDDSDGSGDEDNQKKPRQRLRIIRRKPVRSRDSPSRKPWGQSPQKQQQPASSEEGATKKSRKRRLRRLGGSSEESDGEEKGEMRGQAVAAQDEDRREAKEEEAPQPQEQQQLSKKEKKKLKKQKQKKTPPKNEQWEEDKHEQTKATSVNVMGHSKPPGTPNRRRPPTAAQPSSLVACSPPKKQQPQQQQQNQKQLQHHRKLRAKLMDEPSALTASSPSGERSPGRKRRKQGQGSSNPVRVPPASLGTPTKQAAKQLSAPADGAGDAEMPLGLAWSSSTFDSLLEDQQRLKQ